MPYSQAWLDNDTNPRCILAVVVVQFWNGSAWTNLNQYWGSTLFNTTDNLVSFLPLITNSPKFTETMSVGSNPTLTYGDIQIQNPNGERDSWLNSATYVWANASIQLYYGDPNWVVADLASIPSNFNLVFDGLISDIDSSSRETINFKLVDKLQRLNAPVTINTLGTYGTWAGGQTNQNAILPLVFGEVSNTTPLLIDPATLEYMFSEGDQEGLIEIRDNGVPIWTRTTLTSGATVVNTTGKFKLKKALVGNITVSVQGVKTSTNLSTGATSATYVNNIANIIATLARFYGNSTLRLAATDLDLTNLNAFATANSQPVGIYITGSENLLVVCQTLAASLGAQVYMNRIGKLQILRIGVPQSAATVNITDSDIVLHSLSISQKVQVAASFLLGYCQNWTVQTNLQSGIPQANKDLFTTQWMTVTNTDATVKALYKLNTDPTLQPTLLLTTTFASNEAARLTNYYKVPRIVYKFTGRSKLLALELGQSVTIIHNRFNLYNGGAGVTAQVVSLSPNYLDNTVDVEVIV